ncbi:hypothetical protein LINGRAHAP2_LOCUS30060 [Linum grandiflorum]
MALLDDGGGVTVPEAAADAQTDHFTLCALGTFVTERTINFNAMRTQMANLWRPREGISISDKGEGLILFRFYHPLDLELVLEGVPWTFDQNLLALQALVPGDDITKVPLHEVDFWVHAYGFSAEFYSEMVGKALGDALGKYLTYDEYNMYVDQDSCMRLRVKLDVRKSLLREKEVKRPRSSIMVMFKYEKLPIFCFLCGWIGHIDRACAMRFRFARNIELPLLWDASLRVPQRRILKDIQSPWLIPTPEEQRVATLSRGGSVRQGQIQNPRPRPANIQAIAFNFRSGLGQDATSVLLGMATNVSREGPVEVVDDQKRRKGNDHDEADMEVDTENALKLAINNDSTRAQPGMTKGCTKQLSIT